MQPVANADNSTSLDQSDQSATLALYRAALGPMNTDYYLRAFAAFDAAGRVRPHWNAAAALCTLSWMVLRQLWGAALAYCGVWVAVVLLVVGLGQLVLNVPAATQLGALALVAAVAVLVPGLYGNVLLYRQCCKHIGHALERHSKLEDACAMLLRGAPSRNRLLGVAVGNAVLACIALGVLFVVPHGLGSDLGTQEAAQSVSGKVSSVPVRSATEANTTEASVAAPPAPPQAQAAVPADPTPSSSLTPTPSPLPLPLPLPLPTPTPVPASPQPEVQQAPVSRAEAAQARTPTQPPTPVQAQAQTPSKLPERYLVNVGLFAEEANARRATNALRNAKQPVLRDRIRSSKGVLHRVRVGPFASKADAEQAAQTIQSLQLDAVVVPQQLP